MFAEDLFVTGTDTNVGKTVLSAMLCAALDRPYWKPIQTGTDEGTDRERVVQYAALPARQTIPEAYRFGPPVSPHLAARIAGTTIELSRIQRPPVVSPLVIEGAGGVLVPINDQDLMIDLMVQLKAGVVLAARTTLGTINHSLLSIEALQAAGLDVKGVVMIGPEDAENRAAIERYGNVAVIGSIPPLNPIDRSGLLRVFNERFDHSIFHE